jgi:hypothetical protein
MCFRFKWRKNWGQGERYARVLNIPGYRCVPVVWSGGLRCSPLACYFRIGQVGPSCNETDTAGRSFFSVMGWLSTSPVFPGLQYGCKATAQSKDNGYKMEAGMTCLPPIFS